MTKETKTKYGEHVTVVETEGEDDDETAYARAIEIIEDARREGVGFVLLGPMEMDGQLGTVIITPLTQENTIGAIEGALRAIKSTLS